MSDAVVSAAETSKKDQDKAHDKLVDEAKKRFKRASESENDIRQNALDDLKFRIGDQWPAEVLKQRTDDGRPCLTFNQMPQFCRQVTNDQRQNRPAITISPVDSGADIDTAEILQGLIRHIEYDSSAEAAYDTGFQCAVDRSFGCWYIDTVYSGPFTFEQDIKIRRVLNPFMVYIDPDAREADRSDMNWGFILEDMSKDAFQQFWPDSKLAAHSDWASLGDGSDNWIKEDAVRVARYYYREKKKKQIYLLEDGTVLPKDVYELTYPEKDPLFQQSGMKAPRIVQKRETEITTVHICKINGMEVLEETEWAGTLIPIVMVLGDELNIDGDLIIESLIRHSKDAQRQYNYFATATTETIALAPRAPYIGYVGQFEGLEKRWQNANIKNYPYLEVKPTMVNGQAAPLPQRNTFEPAIQATSMAMMQSAEQLRSTTGIYQASLGEPGDEKSGIAIRNRQSQSQLGNFHFSDNLKRAIAYTGKILLELIPKIYDTARVVRVTGLDGKQSTANIGSVPQDQQAINAQMSKIDRIYDLTVGKYDVVVDAGPGYQTKREQAVDTQLQLLKIEPQLLPIIGDIVVANMDIPQAQEISKRMKKMLPQQLQEEDGPQSQLPPQAQQAISQLMQQNQQLTQALNAAHDDIENKATQTKVKTDSDERIQAMKNAVEIGRLKLDAQKNEIEYLKVQATVITAQMQVDAENADANAQREYDFIQSEIARVHEAAMGTMEHIQGLEAQQQQHEQGLESAEQIASQQPEQPQV